MTKGRKIVLIILSGITLLIVIACLLVYKGALNGIIVRQVVLQANKVLNAKVSVGELTGNPFARLTIRDIRVVQDEKEIIRIGEAEIDYSLLQLFRKRIVINTVKINDLKVDVWQERDSLWNIQKLYKAGDTLKVNNTKGSSIMPIRIKAIELTRFLATIHPLDTASVIPKTVETDLSLSFLMKGDVMKLNLKKMVLKTYKPNIEVKSITFNFISDSASWKWDHLRLQMPRTLILSDGKYYPHQPILSSASLAIDTLAFDDIRKLFPQFTMKGNPSILLSAKGGIEKIDFSVMIKEQLQKCEIKGWVKGLDTIPKYDINVDVSNIDGSFWTGNREYASKITGVLNVTGSGSDPLKGSMTASGNFSEVTYLDKTLKKLIFAAEKDSVLLKGNMVTEAWFGGVAADFSVADYLSKFRYSVIGSGQHINIAKLNLPKNLYSSLNLKINAEGEGMNPMKGSIKANIVSLNSTITNRPIEEFHTRFSYNNGNYDLADFKLNSPFFQLVADGKGDMKHVNNAQFNFETKDFDNLLKLTGFGQYSFDGKIQGELSGSKERYAINSTINIVKFGTDSLIVKDLKGDLNLSKDTVFRANASFSAGEIMMDSIVLQKFGTDFDVSLGKELSSEIRINSDSVSVNYQLLGAIKGEATLQTDDSIRFDVKLKLDSLNYSPFKMGPSSMNLKSRLPKGDEKRGLTAVLHQITDHFNPEPFKKYMSALQRDSVSISGRMDFQNLAYDTLTIDKIGIDLDVVADRNNYRGNLTAVSGPINYRGLRVKKSTLHTVYSNKIFQNELNFTISDSVSGELGVDVAMQKDIEIGLRHLLLRSPAETWKGGGDSTKITYGNNSLNIKNLKIIASDIKYLKADGFFAFKGNENLDVSFQSLDLNNINKIIGGTIPVSGTADGTLKMTGTSKVPIINASLKLNNLTANKQKIDQLQANMVYGGDTIKFDVNVDVKNTRMFEGTLKSGYHFSIEDPTFHLPSPSDYVSGQLKLNRFDLSLLNPFLPSEQINIQGYINSDLKAEGPSNNLKINGFLDWKEGKFHMPEYGILYDRITMSTGIKGDSLFITDFVAEAGAGTLNVNGYSRFNQQDIYRPKALSLKIYGKEFKVIDSERLQATVNTDITLKKENENPVFKGEIEVIRGEANADAFIAEYNKASEEADPPMLIKALARDTTLSAVKFMADTVKVKLNAGAQFYKNLKGSLTVSVPGNMWIRGKDMGFEVKGDLKATKEGANMLLYGDLEVKRGFYKIYGKRFDFKSGKITLTGEDDINPLLDFVVVYSFRNIERAMSNLQLTISGRLKDPKIAFEMDGVKIEEQDALSVIVFGSTSDQLSAGQRSSITTNTSDIAKNIALGQMSTILKDAIQSSLKLDVIEIAGEDNWNSGSVTIGKYISKNLFVSYQYTFALDKKTKIIEPQKISIEYQLFKFLSLTATNQSPNSGFDIIFKKEFK